MFFYPAQLHSDRTGTNKRFQLDDISPFLSPLPQGLYAKLENDKVRGNYLVEWMLSETWEWDLRSTRIKSQMAGIQPLWKRLLDTVTWEYSAIVKTSIINGNDKISWHANEAQLFKEYLNLQRAQYGTHHMRMQKDFFHCVSKLRV